MFKVGDKLESMRGPCEVTDIRANVDDYPVRAEYPNGAFMLLTADGRLMRRDKYPFVWFPETGHGPEVGERPKWKPEKPTWCWVWNGRVRPFAPALRIVVELLEVEGEYTDAHGVKRGNAEPCAPEDIPEWWPEEWK